MPQQPHKSNRTIFRAYKMEEQGNIDFKFWHYHSKEERIAAAATMTEVAFRVPNFLKGKVNRSVYSSRKHQR